MNFQLGDKQYVGATAVEVVRQIATDTPEFTSGDKSSVFEFLQWSLQQLSEGLPPRDLDISGRLSDETLARNYLLLLHQYGHGQLTATEFPTSPAKK
jgi:hypothetical protein